MRAADLDIHELLHFLPEGGIITREGPIHISNVRLVEAAKAAKSAAKKPSRKKKS